MMVNMLGKRYTHILMVRTSLPISQAMKLAYWSLWSSSSWEVEWWNSKMSQEWVGQCALVEPTLQAWDAVSQHLGEPTCAEPSPHGTQWGCQEQKCTPHSRLQPHPMILTWHARRKWKWVIYDWKLGLKNLPIELVCFQALITINVDKKH